MLALIGSRCSLWTRGSAISTAPVAGSCITRPRACPSRGVFHAYCPALDGTPHWWEVSIWLVEEPAGTPDGLIAVAHEVSAERRVLELERESRQSRFRGAESVTRHDILSALSVVKGEAQLLARRAERTQEPLRETCLRSIAAIGAAADRVQSLVDERMAAKQAH
jgi:nitrogen-specific signal transduction histidine kinase